MPHTFDQNIVDKYISLMENDPHHRYWSWDFCYQEFSDVGNRSKQSMSLAMYLASWGMYRGSGGLLQKNYRIHEQAVDIINDSKFKTLICSERQEVNSGVIPVILDIRNALGSYYSSLTFTKNGAAKNISDTDTLTTKIILGTKGCVPAYDRYFIGGLKESKMNKCGFGKEGLEEVFLFIEKNESGVKRAQRLAKKKTNNHYPIMKIIDMYFWQLGYDSERKKKML